MKKMILILTIATGIAASAQQVMTPDLLWKLGRLSAVGLTKDGKNVIYKVSVPDVAENKSASVYYSVPVNGGAATEVTDYKLQLQDKTYHPTANISCTMKK